jgi:ankyrin repeat protein
MTGEYWQNDGRTALLWASHNGHADTARVLVELGASVEAVDQVNIHAHALANKCFIKDGL